MVQASNKQSSECEPKCSIIVLHRLMMSDLQISAKHDNFQLKCNDQEERHAIQRIRLPFTCPWLCGQTGWGGGWKLAEEALQQSRRAMFTAASSRTVLKFEPG
jgi:hypothetical protein